LLVCPRGNLRENCSEWLAARGIMPFFLLKAVGLPFVDSDQRCWRLLRRIAKGSPEEWMQKYGVL